MAEAGSQGGREEEATPRYGKEEVLHYLDDRGVAYERVDHEAVFSMEGGKALDLPFEADVAKNLFLRDDKKRGYYLTMMPRDKPLDLKALRQALGSRRLSFASEEDLSQILGLHPGAVSPFGILNDEERRTQVVIDDELQSHRALGVHPNDNTATLLVPLDALVAMFEEHGTPYSFVSLERPA